jgi:hypothetical protein
VLGEEVFAHGPAGANLVVDLDDGAERELLGLVIGAGPVLMLVSIVIGAGLVLGLVLGAGRAAGRALLAGRATPAVLRAPRAPPPRPLLRRLLRGTALLHLDVVLIPQLLLILRRLNGRLVLLAVLFRRLRHRVDVANPWSLHGGGRSLPGRWLYITHLPQPSDLFF